MCKCVAAIDKYLKPNNGRVDQIMQLVELKRTRNRIAIVTEKLNAKKRKPVPLVLASFCPWCGEKLKDDTAITPEPCDSANNSGTEQMNTEES